MVLLRNLALAASFALLSFAGAAALTSDEAAAELRDPNLVLLRNARIDVTAPAPAAPADLALSPAELRANRHWIVQVSTPAPAQMRGTLAGYGAEILSYVPNRAYVVRADAGVADALRADPGVRWVGAWRPDYKLEAGIGTRTFTDPERPSAPGEVLLVLCAFPGEDLASLAQRVRAAGAEVLETQTARERLIARGARGIERALARIDGFSWIEEAPELTHRNNTTRWVAQSNVANYTPIWDAGLHGEGQIVGHIDGAIRESSCYFDDTVPPGPTHRKIIAYRGTESSSSHGTHTAGTVAGLNPGTLNFAGHAYEAKISHTRDNLITGFGNGTSNLYTYLEFANGDDAHVHTNSWGDDGRTTYTTWCADIDAFSRDYEDDLVLFAVTNLSTLKTPENAKNVLAVGGTLQAPNQASHCTGGQGPTSDGRRKPEIYLPGCSILSASSSSACATQSSSGTSMACPAVAGNAILVRQYYTEGFYPSGAANATDALVPSGALLKATLLNGTEDMTGVTGYPSNREGWGRLNLDQALYLAGDTRTSVIRDVRHADGLSTGGTDEFEITADAASSLAITMVFTDQPALVGAALAPVNDLDLEVEGPDGLFLGNVFAAGSSTTGGSADNLNNVERVVLPAGGFTSGTWTIRVRGAAVPDGPQGYAIHVA
ncbi:MAG: S8 family serine peptidase, partial [Gemmatimonadetes bacterium]|nr:S8 family serine peptidase [Gemmatimonadota bacterium]